jgi:hypothetical protein
MGRSDRCAVLCNSNGVGSSELQVGYAAADDLHGHMGLEFGTKGSGRRMVSEVNDGTGQEEPETLGRCLLDNASECGLSVIN